MFKSALSVLSILLLAACAGQSRPPVETLVKGVESRGERISILTKECEKEVLYGHLQTCPPHNVCKKDYAHKAATRSVCETLGSAVTTGSAASVEQAQKMCLVEAARGKGNIRSAKEEHAERQKELCNALYNERRK
jgi:hypothetical protein